MPINVLEQVQLYNDPSLARLLNSNVFLSTTNTKYKKFNQMPSQLGDSVGIRLPTRANVANGLVAKFQGTNDRLQQLVCNQAANSAFAFSMQEFVFNAEEYMEEYGRTHTLEISTEIESNLALNAVSGVPNYNVIDGKSIPDGTYQTQSGPYRFYGNANDALDSYQDLAEMLARFKGFGCAKNDIKVYLDYKTVVSIIGSGNNEFVLDRNNETSNSWDLGSYKGSNARYYQSNLLPIHEAGTVGDAGTTLTLVSTNDPSGENITQLTFSGASGSDVDAIKRGDLFQFNDSVVGQPNIRYLTWIGHKASDTPVQCRVISDAASTAGGNVTVTISEPLVSVKGPNQNLSHALQVGMQVDFVPSHRAGLVVSGNAFFTAMPDLEDEVPFPTSNVTENNVSLRMYYGSKFGENQKGMVYDAIWGSTLVPEYSMRLILPVS